MGRVLTLDGYAIYVYDERGSPHHLPHCNVRWAENSANLALPTLEKLSGKNVPRRVVKQLRERLDELVAAWEKMNPPAGEG
jgi:hypothetical protein